MQMFTLFQFSFPSNPYCVYSSQYLTDHLFAIGSRKTKVNDQSNIIYILNNNLN